METDVLKTLQCDLGRPLPLSFLRRFSRVAHCNDITHNLAEYLMELSLYTIECSQWEPSLLAATSLYATLTMVCDGQNIKSLIHYTGYEEQRLIENATVLCKLLEKSSKSPESYHVLKKYPTVVALHEHINFTC